MLSRRCCATHKSVPILFVGWRYLSISKLFAEPPLTVCCKVSVWLVFVSRQTFSFLFPTINLLLICREWLPTVFTLHWFQSNVPTTPATPWLVIRLRKWTPRFGIWSGRFVYTFSESLASLCSRKRAVKDVDLNWLLARILQAKPFLMQLVHVCQTSILRVIQMLGRFFGADVSYSNLDITPVMNTSIKLSCCAKNVRFKSLVWIRKSGAWTFR